MTDPRIFELLEVARAILTTTLAESSRLLAELESSEVSAHPGASSTSRGALQPVTGETIQPAARPAAPKGDIGHFSLS